MWEVEIQCGEGRREGSKLMKSWMEGIERTERKEKQMTERGKG